MWHDPIIDRRPAHYSCIDVEDTRMAESVLEMASYLRTATVSFLRSHPEYTVEEAAQAVRILETALRAACGQRIQHHDPAAMPEACQSRQ